MKTPHICCVFWEIRHVWRWYLSKNPCRQCNSMFWLIGDASQEKICADNVHMYENVFCAIACVRTNTSTYNNIKQKHGKKKRTHDKPLLLPVFQFCLSPYMPYLPKRTKTTTAPPCPNGQVKIPLIKQKWQCNSLKYFPTKRSVITASVFVLWTRSTNNQGGFFDRKNTSNQAARRCRMKSRFNGKPMTPGRCACGNLWRVRLAPRVFPHIIAVHHPTHVCFSVKNWYFVVWRLWKSRSFC